MTTDARKVEAEVRARHGAAVPDRLLVAQLPVNERPTGPLGETRRAAFAANMAFALDRALAEPDRPFPETAEPPPAQAPLIRASCAACLGSCCSAGADHAYLYPDHFRRLLRDRPGLTRDQILAEYESRLPALVYQESCVYHTTSGCALPRDLRANLCNTFLCGGLSQMLDAQPKEGAPLPVLAVCARDNSADPVRVTVFDGRGNPLL